ncbi:Lrp/AsnC family transcriptional regulator [Nitrosopumilus ureiphilus]|uniref:AsnC family transcriptional regulator n=1 Tax=Nitrosopumilus ureiphilus TaxID=1470067 RepID=A0A7D5M542_9ARCH|nr:Lrp/AsnC ligand binding domain-containing protein [Nitrosopumilus ureiphilus]QLH06311.1 AsnC family transcriptional regulator [Nitrosopumilus ureiphilus]
MGEAFVLINCEPGKEPLILEQLRKIENVSEIQGTYGIYDIVTRIESDNQSQLDNIISDQIRKLDYVNSTLTLIPTDEHESSLSDLIPDIMPDVIPEQKKPLGGPFSEEGEDDFDEDYDEDYDDSTKLNQFRKKG